jgi:tight adherence protein C
VILVVLGSAAVMGSVLTLWWTLSAAQRTTASAARNLAAGLPLHPDLRAASLSRSVNDRAVTPLVAGLARKARPLTPVGRLEALERRILLAGAAQDWPLERVLAAKLVFGSAGALLGGLSFLGNPGMLALVLWLLLGGLGFFGADLLLVNRAQKRVAAVRRKLPDTLDQLTISVEAGLGFDAALARVARSDDGPLARELVRTMQDVQAGMSRREALHRLNDRVEVAELRSFVNAVTQAEQYGLPIGSVLRVQAGELRTRRRQQAEEKAVKLPVKMMFPTVVFIFPVLFIVLLGPAMIQIMQGIFGK